MEAQQYAPFTRPKYTVLVEDDLLVRTLWEKHYRAKGWSLETFENPLDFLNQLDRFTGRDEEIYFFFDQDFGRVRGVGVELARAVHGRNSHQSVALVTNHDPVWFTEELNSGRIRCVFDKYPAIIFGENFLGSELRKDPKLVLRSLSAFDELGALEKALETRGKSIEFSLEKHFPAFAARQKPEPCESKVVIPVIGSDQAEASQSQSPKKRSFWDRLIDFLAGSPRPLDFPPPSGPWQESPEDTLVARHWRYVVNARGFGGI